MFKRMFGRVRPGDPITDRGHNNILATLEGQSIAPGSALSGFINSSFQGVSGTKRVRFQYATITEVVDETTYTATVLLWSESDQEWVDSDEELTVTDPLGGSFNVGDKVVAVTHHQS